VLLVVEGVVVLERVQGWREVEAVAAVEEAREQAQARAQALDEEAEGVEVVPA
jgi:hypothetical protein